MRGRGLGGAWRGGGAVLCGGCWSVSGARAWLWRRIFAFRLPVLLAVLQPRPAQWVRPPPQPPTLLPHSAAPLLPPGAVMRRRWPSPPPPPPPPAPSASARWARRGACACPDPRCDWLSAAGGLASEHVQALLLLGLLLSGSRLSPCRQLPLPLSRPLPTPRLSSWWRCLWAPPPPLWALSPTG